MTFLKILLSVFSYLEWVKKKEPPPIYFNTNYHTEMKLMYYCLPQFDALKFFLGVRLHGGPQPNFNFFNVNPHIFQRNHNVHL